MFSTCVFIYFQLFIEDRKPWTGELEWFYCITKTERNRPAKNSNLRVPSKHFLFVPLQQTILTFENYFCWCRTVYLETLNKSDPNKSTIKYQFCFCQVFFMFDLFVNYLPSFESQDKYQLPVILWVADLINIEKLTHKILVWRF